MNPAEAKKQFEKCLGQLAYSQSLWTVFNDFLDYSLIMMRWWDLTAEHFAELEKKYPEPEQHKLFVMAYTAMADIAEDDGQGFKDPFGDWFMEHLSNDRRGQFFTPEELCDMTAMMQIDESTPDDATFLDPTCGSGRMLLSAARLKGKASFYAADIDITCCKMTVINFMLNTMVGEVAWMDTLRMDHWKSWHIKRVMDGNGYYLPYYITTEAGDTNFIQRLKNTVAPKAESAGNAVPVEYDEVKANKKGQILLFS